MPIKPKSDPGPGHGFDLLVLAVYSSLTRMVFPQEEGSKAANVETAQLMDTPQAKTAGDADVDMRDAGPPTSNGAGEETPALSSSTAHAGLHTGLRSIPPHPPPPPPPGRHLPPC